jgi:hypothetical protein
MALPTGTISMSQVNLELSRPAGQSISLDDAGVRGLAGRSSGYLSMSHLQGKSAINTGISSNISDQNVGNGFRHTRGSISIYVLPTGAGTATGHVWELVQDDYGMAYVSNPNTAVATFEGPSYNFNNFTVVSNFVIRCTYTVNGSQFVREFSGAYTIDQLA